MKTNKNKKKKKIAYPCFISSNTEKGNSAKQK